MADKAINELVAATSVGANDLFVLEQSSTAKKLTGQILENWLVSLADGHGGIQSIAKTSTTGTNPVVDTYTITYADTTTSTFTVTNGIKGDTGAQTYVWVKWASVQPTADNQMSDFPDAWMGIYVGLSSTAPTAYTSYTWYQIKGDKGDTGDGITLVDLTAGDHSPGSTDTYTVYAGDNAVGSFTVYQGLNGTGAVSSVNNVFPDGNGNVALAASDIGIGAATTAPGSDVVNGAVGTATTYARGDHRHELNVPISGTPADLGTASNGSSTNYARADHVHNSLIVASGSATSGNATWTYRRWADGMVEAWGVYSASIAVSTTGYNGYRSGEISFPIPAEVGLYNSDYVIIGQKANANEIALWSLYKSSTTAAKMYFYSGASSTNTCTVHAYLMGRWKE